MKKISFLISTMLFILCFIAGCKEEENPVVPPSEHFSPEGWILQDEAMNNLLVVWQGQIQNDWNGAVVNDTLGTFVNITSPPIFVRFLNADKIITDIPGDTDYEFGWVITDSTYFTILEHEPGWAFHLTGKKEGVSTLELQVLHEGHADVRTPKIPVRIN